MTPRCGYYIEDDRVKEMTVQIAWDKGFGRDAKYLYIADLHRALSEQLNGNMLEVTTASPFTFGRALSPFYLKYDETTSLEDYWGNMGKIEYYGYTLPQGLRKEAFIHCYCIAALLEIDTIRKVDVFTDIFHNPDKKLVTQAEACAVLKLMDKRNELECLHSIASFLTWMKEHGRR